MTEQKSDSSFVPLPSDAAGTRRGPAIADRKLIPLLLGLCALIFVFDLSLPLGVAGGVLYVLVVVLSLWSARSNVPIWVASAVSILVVLGFALSPTSDEVWKAILNRSLSLFAIWTPTILGVQKITTQRERDDALAQIKILSGLLPICASCKRIRDDRGYWEQLETYIGDHSEARFSHCICPRCAKKLYPDLAEEAGVDQGDESE